MSHPDFDRVDQLDRLSKRLDTIFRIPGTRIRLGWDGIASIVPGIGDALAAAPAAYIVYQSYKMGVPNHLLARQVTNVGIDALVGSVPVVGTLFDIGFKANIRNVALLKKHLEDRHGTAMKDVTPVDGEFTAQHPGRDDGPDRARR